MKSTPASPNAPGRPPEIEELANRFLVHPASRALVNWLVRTRVTPNQISVSSVFAAAAAGAGFLLSPPIWRSITGLAGLFLWHVLDGADGDLARRTGRASVSGELIDGVCDHLSQALIYISLGILLQRTLAFWAWPVTVAAALSHLFQANAYEVGRKTYRHWVYGATWMRQSPNRSRSLSGFANRAYLAAAALFSPNEQLVEKAMERQIASAPQCAAMARDVYKKIELSGVKSSSVLGSTSRTAAIVVSLLAGSPLWFFLYEIVLLNAVLAIIIAWRRQANLRVHATLSSFNAKL